MLAGLSITPTPVEEDWRPTLQCAVTSGGESTVAAAVMVLAVIPVVTADAVSEVSLAPPPPPTVAEEERETELPASPGGGLHGSPSWSEPKAPGESVAGTESERPVVARSTEVVDIPFDDEADDMVELPVLSWELVVVQSEAGPSDGVPKGDLEWPCPEDPAKVRFVLRDSQEFSSGTSLGSKDMPWCLNSPTCPQSSKTPRSGLGLPSS